MRWLLSYWQFQSLNFHKTIRKLEKKIYSSFSRHGEFKFQWILLGFSVFFLSSRDSPHGCLDTKCHSVGKDSFNTVITYWLNADVLEKLLKLCWILLSFIHTRGYILVTNCCLHKGIMWWIISIWDRRKFGLDGDILLPTMERDGYGKGKPLGTIQHLWIRSWLCQLSTQFE